MSAPTEQPLLLGKWDDASLTDKLISFIWAKKGPIPRWLFAITGLGTLMLFASIGMTIFGGIGVWGNNIPVAWGFGIINFVWWIGIGHAGTFISAVLLLLEQRWRTTLNRFAESMTLFALVQAGMYPLLHLGRPWFFYWLVPYPNTMQMWPQFLSALADDVAAISTYTSVSIMFWYVGLIPDLAAVRDRAVTRSKRRIYGLFALGWRGSAEHWRHYRSAQLMLAGLATPLVLSVHSIVSMDFAQSKLPGWHSLIFPPYFVAGAIFSGFAMVITLMIPARKIFRLEQIVTMRHLDLCAKLVLLTGMLVSYSYLSEHFIALYSGYYYEQYMFFHTRALGPYAFTYWLMLFCNVVVPQVFWFRAMRQNLWVLFVASLLVQLGMWLERFVLIVTSQHQDFLPSSWAMYTPSLIDWTLLLGTISFFLFLFLLLLRFIPFIPLTEVKEDLHEHGGHHDTSTGATHV